MDFRIELAHGHARLSAIAPAWEELAANACEQNPFYEPWYLLAALRARGGDTMRCVLLWDGERLAGLFPFERVPRYKGLPLAALASWRQSTHLLGTPLVRADCAVEALQALLAWRGADAAVLELRYVPQQGPFAVAMAKALRRSRSAFVTTAQLSRPLLRRWSSGEAYLGQLSAHLRKDLRRKQRQLAERPGYAELVRGPGDDFSVELERLGSFGREVLGEAARRGRLHMVGIACDGRVIARRFSLLAGEGTYAYRSAHDESYAAYSPGVVAEALRIREFHRLPRVQWMDSYAEPHNARANRLWREQRAIESVAIALGAWGEFWLKMLPLAHWTARRLRGTAQTAEPRRLAA
jgi:CelD/BcsL family acetyltransferase involved in cellulose biosynthesis